MWSNALISPRWTRGMHTLRVFDHGSVILGSGAIGVGAMHQRLIRRAQSDHHLSTHRNIHSARPFHSGMYSLLCKRLLCMPSELPKSAALSEPCPTATGAWSLAVCMKRILAMHPCVSRKNVLERSHLYSVYLELTFVSRGNHNLQLSG